MRQLTHKKLILVSISALFLAVIALGMLTIGTANVPFNTVAHVMAKQLLGLDNIDISSTQQTIVWNIRWQRIALAMIVGSGLAVSGACFQTMFKNPLADPFVLGVSSGAALGAAVAIITHSPNMTIVFAFSGAMLSLSLVYLLGLKGMHIQSDQQLLLAGIACGAMLNAMLSCLMALNSQQMQTIMFWLMGSLSNYSSSLKPVLAIVVCGLIIAMIYARDLDVMALGDEDAQFLGVDVKKVKFTLLISTTLVTGACVSVSGIIGFIGLIVPHLVRKLAGPEHLLLLPLSAIFGAAFLLLADGLTRLLPLMSGIPVGVVTALFGSPFFLYVLCTLRRGSH
ncbi:MAG: iron ABC transporter permease [Veillonellaceae bacterium]|jgi:iron complex transport system permease protein|nr:iron ABC transporter permease [Veillonellaceae bacterium]